MADNRGDTMTDLNRKKLSEEFSLDLTDDKNINKFLEDVKPPAEGEDPDDILRENIQRANRFLDRVENEIESGNFSARILEVAGLLLNSVTAAASQIQSSGYNEAYLQVREKLVSLKQVELELRRRKLEKGSGGAGKQQMIIASREDILGIIRGNNSEESVNPKTVNKIQEGEGDENE